MKFEPKVALKNVANESLKQSDFAEALILGTIGDELAKKKAKSKINLAYP